MAVDYQALRTSYGECGRRLKFWRLVALIGIPTAALTAATVSALIK
jgi:hypothetical protein